MSVKLGENMKVIIYNVVVLFSLIVATILGIYGQNLSYYINGQFPTIEVKTAVFIVYWFSIGLFIITPILLFVSKKSKLVSGKIYLIACLLLGLPMSLWSLFVMAMWTD